MTNNLVSSVKELLNDEDEDVNNGGNANINYNHPQNGFMDQFDEVLNKELSVRSFTHVFINSALP